MQEPCLIELQKIGTEEIGYISIAQSFSNVPFDIKRVYWIYQTPEMVERGHHAHKNTEQLIFCITGRIKIILENRERKIYEFVLDNPNQGLYVPTNYWSRFIFSKDSIGACLASLEYNETDYMRDFSEFLGTKK